MKLAIFGLAISSSWGNGHATLWRGLCKALARLDCRVVFFERNQPWYANDRDFLSIPSGELIIYEAWHDIRDRARAEVVDADAAIVTSYCPDAIEAKHIACSASRPLAVFYDLDTPVTLARVRSGEIVPYVGEHGLQDYDLVLSFGAGETLDQLREVLGARRTAALYGHADPEVHRPATPEERYSADLSWLGTYADDRRAAMDRLFIEPARERPALRFLMGGAQYPDDFPWTDNIYFVRHVPPPQHPAFFCSSRLTLNITREAMTRVGWCPPGRMFEAAACGAALLTDAWPGLEAFYEPGVEVLVARTTQDALDALDMSDAELRRIAQAARERTLQQHTSHHRALELIALLESYDQRTSSTSPRGEIARSAGEVGVQRTRAERLSTSGSHGRPNRDTF